MTLAPRASSPWNRAIRPWFGPLERYLDPK
jgi:hypothetical protein